ncbi:FAD-dependent oxidoreductase [Sphingomonas sp. AOB5]|uniref:FAD-dependent oxidoreductase n=1 Tax=Sphingomonas sp. AOB5 TaxID=3034017 RepID=UPI0023F6692E|nr:FAD-dependent oxidoreductase [Sphingomonas sp. AOB5]MDF7775490.1 FAD-dependent oxidoreductase [Sphingomonas sp. AOB5]
MTGSPNLHLSRRTLVAGLGALALPGCAHSRGMGRKGCSPLPPVIVDPARIIRQAVGFRPYRPSGFVVRRDDERLAPKRLVHNYGHGGGGITLSWGSSKLAVDLGLPGHRGPVAVIGAGALGLTTAKLVQEAGFPVTLYAAALPPNTTSNIAGGEWHPAFAYDPEKVDFAFRGQLREACRYSYERFQTMIGADYGVRWMRNHEMSGDPIVTEDVDKIIYDMLPRNRALRQSEHPFPFAHVRSWDCPIVETPIFLRAMVRDLLLGGAKFVVGKIEAADQLRNLSETLVFNCTGLGAAELFGDKELIPVRGQLVMLQPQPEVTYAIHAPDVTYMFSRSDAIILGGTAGFNDTNPNIVPQQTLDILTKHRRVFDRFRCT